jgi:hypothetical protein
VTSILPHPKHPPAPSTTVPLAGTTTTTAPPAGQGVTAIGDSIMVDAAPYLQSLLPGITIDAQVGQQLYQVQEAVAQLKAEGAVGDRLILELGTNGPYTVAQLEALLNSLGPQEKVVLVNTSVPRPWAQQVNAAIATVAQSYPNTVVVPWSTDSANCAQCLYPDGVHLDPNGAKYYAFLLAEALQAPLPSVHHPVTSASKTGTSKTGTSKTGTSKTGTSKTPGSTTAPSTTSPPKAGTSKTASPPTGSSKPGSEQ